MKLFVANILFICCFSLTVLPGVAALNNQPTEVHCCSSDCENEDNTANNKNHDCANEICNPFTHCNCCIGFVASPAIISSTTVFPIDKLKPEKIPFQKELFIKSNWQPPKYG